MKTPEPLWLIRVIEWFEKDPGGAPLGRVVLRRVRLDELQTLLNVPSGDPMLESFQITEAHRVVFEKWAGVKVDLEHADYFVLPGGDRSDTRDRRSCDLQRRQRHNPSFQSNRKIGGRRCTRCVARCDGDSVSTSAREEIRKMMETFIRGENQSVAFVNGIEQSLRDHFRGQPVYEDLVEDLATYSPGGGEFLTDEKTLTREFEYAIDRWLK